MAELRSTTAIGGNIVWHGGNLRFEPQGQTIRYHGYKVFTERDTPLPGQLGNGGTTSAFTKSESDSRFAPITSGGYVRKVGDTMSGKLTNTGNEIEIRGSSPRLLLQDNDGTKRWYMINDGGNFSIRENDTSGTRFRIDSSYTNMLTDNISIHSKVAFRGYDAWLRINDQSAFTTGVYFGSSLVRTDGTIHIGSSGATFNASSSAFTYKGGKIFHEAYHPNADKWTTARTITLAGDASGSVSIDGTANKTLTVAVANDSHTHDGRYYTESESDSRFLYKNERAVDSDKLKGIDPTRVVYGSNGTKTTNTINANGILPSGFYAQHKGDMPTSNYYSYINMRHADESSQYGAQIAVSFLNSTIYSRNYHRGDSSGNGVVFSEWAKNWNNHNDGAGSGLDADLLDGLQASQFVRSDTGTISDARLPSTITSSITGNAATATKWTTARIITLAGHASGSVSIDGTANKTLTVAVANDSHTHDGRYYTEAESNGRFLYKGEKAADSDKLDGLDSTSFVRSDATDTVTGQLTFTQKLTSTVSAGVLLNSTASGFDQIIGINDGAGGAYIGKTNYWIRTGNSSIHPQVIRAGTSYPLWYGGNDGAGSGLDADLLDGLQASQFVRSDTGTISDARLPSTITSSITGNAATASKWATARTITLAGDASGSVSIDGTANTTLTVSVNNNSHSHSELTGSNYTSGGLERPNFFGGGKLRYAMLGSGGANGGIPGVSYSDAIWVSGYTGGDVKGSNVLLFSKYNSRIGFRWQNYDSTTWGAFNEIYHTGYKPTKADVGLGNVPNWSTATFDSRYVTRTGDSMGGNLRFTNHGIGVTGTYSATRFQGVFAMGDAYQLPANGNGLGSHYGIAWTHSNNTNGNARKISGHHACFVTGGATKSAIGDSIWTSGNVTAYSDRRVKGNIETIPDALDKVHKLGGYTFNRTDITYDEFGSPSGPVRQTGVIAQEVLEVLPEAVTGSEEDHYSVAYGNMVGLLIEAIKELDDKVDSLQTELKETKRSWWKKLLRI